MRTHGKVATYQHGCRCVECREESARYRRTARAAHREVKRRPSGVPPVEDPMRWADRAACADVPKSVFFPDYGGLVGRAKVICEGCEVRDDCLAYALRTDQPDGVWGGLSLPERQRMQKASA